LRRTVARDGREDRPNCSGAIWTPFTDRR